jgi:hypothetical protein
MTAYKGQEIVPLPPAEVAGRNSLITPGICEAVSRYFRTTLAS